MLGSRDVGRCQAESVDSRSRRAGGCHLPAWSLTLAERVRERVSLAAAAGRWMLGSRVVGLKHSR